MQSQVITSPEWVLVEKRYEASCANKDTYMKKVKKLNDYYKGNQWTSNPKRSWQSQPVCNFTANAVQTKVAALVQQVPGTIIDPRSPENKPAADALKRIIQYVQDANDMPLLLDKFEFYRTLFGTGVWQVAWNPTLLNGLGEIEYRIIDLFDFFPDPTAHDIDECEWVIVRTKRSPRYIKERYKVDVAKDIPIGGEENPYNNQPDAETNKEERVTVYQMVSRGDNGWDITTVAGGKTLRQEPNALRRLPYVVGCFEQLPKSFWGCGQVELFLGDQDIINQTTQIMVDGARVASNMQKEVDRTLLTEEMTLNDFDNTSGRIYFKNGQGDLITPVKTGSIPAFIRELRANTIEEYRQHTSSSDVARGESPSGRPTGRLIETLAGIGDRLNQRVLNSQYAWLKNINEITIELAYDYYDTTRTFMVLGAQGKPEYFDFNSLSYVVRDENGEPMTDGGGRLVFPEMYVRIIPGSGLPNGGRWRVERAVTAKERSALPRRKFLEELGYDDAQELVDELKAEEEEERQKNIQMQVYQNQLGTQAKQQMEPQAPTQGAVPEEEGGSTAPSGVDAVVEKLNALQPEELQMLFTLPQEQLVQELQELSDTPLTEQDIAALLQIVQAQ